MNSRRPSRQSLICSSLLLVSVVVAGIGCDAPPPVAPSAHQSVGNPTVAPSAPAAICGSKALRSPWRYDGRVGTYTAKREPKGLPTFGSAKSDFPSATKIIVVPAGNNTVAAVRADYQVSHAIVYFEPGIHQLKDGMYTGHNSVYIGGYSPSRGGAILDGVAGATDGTARGDARLAESKSSSGNNVYDTWDYLTIRNFTSSLNNSVMGNVNDGGTDIGDTYKYDTIGPNEYSYAGGGSAPKTGMSSGGGYAIDAGSDTTIEYDCLTHNAQGAFNAFDVEGLNIEHNEISRNGIGEYPDIAGPGGSSFSCGCSGGGKIFYSLNTNVIDNYVHNNYNDGIWFDTDNAGADIAGNYVASNWGGGLVYEASYNANISDNTLVGNGWASDGAWPTGIGGKPCYKGVSCTDGFGPITGVGGGNAYAAIDLSNSGGNSDLRIYAGTWTTGTAANCWLRATSC